MLDLLLIRPSNDPLYPRGERKSFLEPLGLEYIAASCIEKGFAVRILDYDNAYTFHENYDPFSCAKHIGISVVSPLVQRINDIIKAIRLFGMSKIILGGPHISALVQSGRRDLIEALDCDYAVVGEGEASMPEILAGIVRDKIIIGKQMESIDDYSFPERNLIDRDCLNLDFDFGINQKLASVITSRSCPYQCVFCGSKAVFGRKLRLRSPEHVEAELKELKAQGINTLIFLDDTFTFNKARTLKLCEIIGRLDFQYWIDTRVDSVDEDIIKMLKGSGCRVIVFGDESGDDEILKRIKKGITVKQIINAHDLTHKIGIHTKANFMIGHPGETEEQALRTIELSGQLGADRVSFYKVIPLPGTELFDVLAENDKKNFTNFGWYKNPPNISAMGDNVIEEILQMAAA